MSGIWEACQGESHIGSFAERTIRVIESQEKMATMALVDTPEEQGLLEEILESSKPAAPPGAEGVHYLIMTPFRYPPLRHGSRFGTRSRRGIFYGSMTETTVFAECAYYRLVFWDGMETPPPVERLITEHTSFEADFSTDRGIRLDQAPFADHSDDISDPASYAVSQSLGEAMNKAGVEAFRYFSARDTARRLNLGVFAHGAIRSPRPENERLWMCTTTADSVTFIRSHARNERYSYPREQFLINGSLPTPAL